MEISIPKISGGPLVIPIEAGERLFVVGANGSGKTALLQHVLSQMRGKQVRKSSAFRQIALASHKAEGIGFRAHEIMAADSSGTGMNVLDEAIYRDELLADFRWQENQSEEKLSQILFELVAKENRRARSIASLIEEGDSDSLEGVEESVLTQLNEVLKQASFKVSIEIGEQEKLIAKRGTDYAYSIARMSDGERNAMILAAEVLTAEPDTIIVIDEPDKHLHRSIIEPFISALFEQRRDCAFIVVTYEITLPGTHRDARVLKVQACEWDGDSPRAWDAEVLESGEELPEDLRRDILGARRRILFVEGTANSRDLPLYGAMFPELSVIPKKSCEEVTRAAKGLGGSYGHHYVEAVGLIDRDDRTQDQVNELAQDNVFALDVCSVESLYYCSDAIEAVACRQAESLGRDPQEMLEAAKQNALEAIGADRDLPERMAARRSERLVHNRFTSHLPDWREIRATGEQLTISEPIENPYQDELIHFNGLVESGDLDGLIARYPLRESRVLEGIVATLGCRSQADYESMVVARVRGDADLARDLKGRLGPLAEWLDNGRSNDA